MTTFSERAEGTWVGGALLSLVAAAVAIPASVLVIDQVGQEFSFFVLGVWLVVLFMLARLFRPLTPAYVAVASVAAIWLVQRLLFLWLIPGKFLEYGVFLRPEGRVARLWVLEIPFAVGAVVLSATLAWGLVVGWRLGRRWSLLALFLWWGAAFLVFVLPSLYLYLQGDAAIFI